MDVFDLVAKISLDDSAYESGLNNASAKNEGLSASTIAMGTLMAEAFSKVISKVSEYGQKIIEVGSEQETALAKVNTIMDTSKKSTEEMASDIKSLSSNMGISVNELSDSVYNIISATGDTENALSLAEKASKLATAGFTDTGSAVGVLTTAMNAYHLSAEDATHISDSLITVQNLGVTTVAELSSSMGKAIASASAYGVNLENLESAYISITKAGINTAEGTTYISSMLKELGDSGSDVSGILQDKTGKSFDQLLGEGKSLGDVLSILNESVDGDATALMNLWSSAEAGKASSAIIGQGIEQFNGNLKELQETTGTTQTAYDTMADTFEHKTEVMKTRLENFGAGIFDKISPQLSDGLDNIMKMFEENSDDITELVDTLINGAISLFEVLVPVAEKAVEMIGGVVKAITAISKNQDALDIIESIAIAIGVVVGAIKAWTLVQTALNIVLSLNPIGLVIIAITALIAIVVMLVKHWDEVVEGAKRVWEAIKEAFGNLGEWFKGIWEDIKKAFAGVGDWFKNKFTEAKDGIKSAWSNITGFFTEKWDAIKNIFATAKDKFKDVGRNIVEGIKNGITNAWESFKSWVMGKFQGIVDGVKGVFGIHSPSKVFQSIGEMCVAGLENGSEGLFDGNNFGISASVKTENVGSNSFSFDYDKLGQSVANALAGFSINMDGRSVAQLLAGDMNYQLGVLNARRV